MIFLLKKLILTVFIICLIIPFNVSARYEPIVNNLEPYGEFYIFDEQCEEVAKSLGLKSEAELKDYCTQNGVIYLAVNKDNTKQIKVTVSETDFSNSVINISGLSNDSINALTPDIIGMTNVKGEIVDKDGQKFVKTQVKASDSGGEYILTQYFTVADRSSIVLSFCTEINTDTDYIEKTFETFSSPYFIGVRESRADKIGVIVLIAAVIFGVACIIIAFTVIRDFKKEKTIALIEEDSKENDK